jgi:hypothetical protein
MAIDDKQFREKTWVFVWFLPKDHNDGSQKFCEVTPTKGGVKLMGVHSRYSVCGNRNEFRTDEQLHRNIVHSVTHLLLSAQKPTAWIGNMKGGWLDEGLAHWFEDRVNGICDNYCMQEDVPNPDFEKGHYRFGVRKLVAKGDLPPIAEVTTHNVDTLTIEMNAIVFSYVDYLIPLGAEKLDALAKKLKVEAEKTSDVIDVSYGRVGEPETPACVLQNLSKLYVEKHLQLLRPSGAANFFADETEKHRRALDEAEARLIGFSQKTGVAAPEILRTDMAQQLALSEAALNQTQQMIAANQLRMENLKKQMAGTPARSSTAESHPDAAPDRTLT